MNKNSKVFIANTALYANNKGIEAITKVSIELIEKILPNTEIVIWQTPPEGMNVTGSFIEKRHNITIYKETGIFSFLLKTIFHILCLLISRFFGSTFKSGLLYELSSSDVIINFNYGDLFTDCYYGRKIWYLMVISNILLILAKKPLIVFPQSIGPFHGVLNKFIATKLLKSSKVIMPREEYSKKILINVLGIDPGKILLTPDIAFLLKAVSRSRIKEILKSENVSVDVPKPVVGFVFNPYLKEIVLKNLIDIITFVESTLNGTVILIPHTVSQNETYDGGKYNCLVGRLLQDYGCDNVFSLTREYSASELKGLIGFCDAIITFPTHAAIAALSIGVPTIALAYSHKTTGIFESFKLENNVISLTDFVKTRDKERLKVLLEKLLNDKTSIKNMLLSKCARNIEEISENVEQVLTMAIASKNDLLSG